MCIYISMSIELACHSRTAAKAVHTCMHTSKQAGHVSMHSHDGIACWLHRSEAPYRTSNQQRPAPQYRPPHAVHDTACARTAQPLAALQLPPPLRLGCRPRPAATPLFAGRPRAYKSAHPDTPSHACLLASSASTPRPLRPVAPAPERAPLAAHRRRPQRLVPLQRGGQRLDGALPDRLQTLSALRHGLRGDARWHALRLRGIRPR
jgi:hypothetical protein